MEQDTVVYISDIIEAIVIFKENLEKTQATLKPEMTAYWQVSGAVAACDKLVQVIRESEEAAIAKRTE